MTKMAWVFPGQGSQAKDMGIDLATAPDAKAMFEAATAILGWSVLDIVQRDDDKLSNTLYTQPCLYVVESILAHLLKQQGTQPAVVAGHSLGEYVALYAAGVYDFEAGLSLVKRRAELMTQASDGTMAALMGFDWDELTAKISAIPDVVLANDNNPGQVVISGKPTAVEAVMAEVKSKRAVKLNVSGAFHSPLMADAASEFQPLLDGVAFHTAQIPVLSNVDPTPSTDGAVLRQRLSQQMTGSVRWRETALALPDLGIDTVVEIGPGNVLTGLIKRTCKSLTLKNVSSLEDLEAFNN